MKRTALSWLAFGIAAWALLPWYLLREGVTSFAWINDPFGEKAASGLGQVLFQGRIWLVAPMIGFAGSALALAYDDRRKIGTGLALAGGAGLVLGLLQGLLIVRDTFEAAQFSIMLAAGQPGMGAGAALTFLSLLMLTTTGISMRKRGAGDAFVTGSIGLIMALVAVFVFYPMLHILVRAFEIKGGGGYSFGGFFPQFFSSEIWGAACLTGGGPCGPGFNSVLLGLATGVTTVGLGLSFALVFTRTNFPAKKFLRILTILPIITPPFVIGLALVLLFGRSGTITLFFAELFGVEATRWLYGFWGIWLAQVLSFTPIAFLILIGVVQGVSPSMEEASQTLNATRWQTFANVSFPLMRPGLANAFLIGFIESLADFGNPLVLGGNIDVLSTEIYFAIVGTVANPAKAAVLSLALLSLALGAFTLQRLWVGRKSYATVTGKADQGLNAELNPALKALCYGTALPWAAFTIVVYLMIIFGSFVKLWGFDHTLTIEHYARAFGVDFVQLRLTGSAWASYFTTLEIAAITAPFTAVLGLISAWLLVRQNFAGKPAFEFLTMLSFAIPGTAIGVAYVMAFNFPPVEITGTSAILILCFVFRNMPVGLRSGIAAMSQIDKSLDEASVTLGAGSFQTLRQIVLPLLGPAILSALAYAFVRAITSVSAVIFLVSARHNMATAYIVNRVENGEFGLAIAYCAVLIITMLVVLLGLQAIIGERRLRRTPSSQTTPLPRDLIRKAT